MHRFLAFQSFPAVLTAVLLTSCGGDSGGASPPPPPPAATHFSVTAPAVATAGKAFNFTLTALDASNKVVAGYSGKVHFTSTDGQAVLPANSTLANGTKTFSATLKIAGGQTITGTDTAAPSITGTSSSINIPGATQLSVTAPTTAGPGTAFNVTVTALDASNHVVTGYSGTVHFTSTDGQAALPANSALANGSMTFSATLKTPGGQTITATDMATPSIAGTSSSIQVSASRFQSTGSMGTARVSHTATLLDDGEVLITGGTDDATVFSSAELFNAASGSFTPTGSMTTPRQSHTATLLNSAKVLITGGENTATLQTAELFTRRTGTFTVTGRMTIARKGHTATLLTNGMVLITGGLDTGGTALATAELFDPGTGIFTAIGSSMRYARAYHSATLLSDGEVLISGGSVRGIWPAELFDPSTGAFTAINSMKTPFARGTATLLNGGAVLVAGGLSGRWGIPQASAELFELSGRSFIDTGSLMTARGEQTATLRNDGTVLMAGGIVVLGPGHGCNPPPNVCPPQLGATSSAELFDPTYGTFVPTDDMVSARSSHTATLLDNGVVLMTGGRGVDDGALATAELYQ